jgi:hypothetical protein
MTRSRKSKPARGHHIIPAHLLGQFALPETLNKRSRERIIWVYEKKKTPAKRSVESQCKENDYFSTIQADGTSSVAHEAKLNETVEIPFNNILSVIESPLYAPSLADALIVYRYVANMFTRSKQRRAASRANRSEINALYAKISNDQTRLRLLAAALSLKFRRGVFFAEVEEVLKDVDTRLSVDERQHSSDFVESIDAFDEDIVRMLQGRPYGLLIAPAGKHFVIGDNPVLTRTPHGRHLLVGDGFNKPNVHVLMPISSNFCLQIGLDGDFSRTVQPEEVDGINFDIITLCHRAVYASDNFEHIRQAMDQSAGSRKYKRDVFITPPLTEEQLFDFFVKSLLGINPYAGNDDPIFRLWRNVQL